MIIKRRNTCLSDKELSLFLDRKSSSANYEAYIKHFAECSGCLDKALDIQRLMRLDECSVPHELKQRLSKSTMKPAGTVQRINLMNILRPIALAASIVVIVLAGFYTFISVPEKVVTDHTLLEEKNSKSVEKIHEYSTVAVQKIQRKKYYKRQSKYPVVSSLKSGTNKKMLRAGYLYFALRNSKKIDRRLVIQLSANLSGTNLDLNEMISLLKHKRFNTFQKRVSSLSAHNRSQFSEGYIQSHLCYLDKNGNLDRELVKKGKRMVLKASTSDIQECMLYQKHLLYLY